MSDTLELTNESLSGNGDRHPSACGGINNAPQHPGPSPFFRTGSEFTSPAAEVDAAAAEGLRCSSPPSAAARWKLRIAFEVRRRCGAALAGLRDGARVPFLPSVIGFLKARAEVLRALRRVPPAVLPDPGPDAVTPDEIPSVRTRGPGDRILAEIDQDGFAFAVDPEDVPYFNRRERMLPRRRYRLEVVLHGGAVCLRKQFVRQPLRRGLRAWFWSRVGLPFYNEAACLLRLRGLGSVPVLRAVDRATGSIYMDYLRGETLRHRVGAGGTAIHDLDLDADPELSKLSGTERDRRERALYAGGGSDGCRDALRRLILEMNRRGVAPLDVKLGNVLVGGASGAVYWLDFERAALRSAPGWRRLVQAQHALMNEWFDAGFVTRDDIAARAKKGGVYSPVDFGGLGFLGDVSNVETGEGRWRWLLSRQTDWRRKRILDLGSNNCLYALRALQAGAAEAHCVERDPGTFEQALLVRRAVEQQAERPLNLHLHNTDIAGFLEGCSFAEEHFDISMALCSIYYLSDDEITRSMTVLARIARECWLQANVWTERESPEIRERATVAYLAAKLRAAGFSDVTLIAPKGYRRPLLIGRKLSRAGGPDTDGCGSSS